jgi:hypothetical protein
MKGSRLQCSGYRNQVIRTNVCNMSNIRRDVSKNFRNKKKEDLKAIVDELETNSKIKTIWQRCRGFNDFKKC